VQSSKQRKHHKYNHHRDIKPDNFLVGGEGGQVVKLCDFGLSALIPREGVVAGIFGTAPFMSPEMLYGRWYDDKTDVWSFAVIVYALLFGSFPYTPEERSSPAMKVAIRAGTTPSFQPAATGCGVASRGSRSPVRSEAAMQLVKTLLDRDQHSRPSAREALGMILICESLHGCHLPHLDLPTLRPMLHAAKKIGVFETRDPTEVTADDVLLNQLQTQLQTQRHSAPSSKRPRTWRRRTTGRVRLIPPHPRTW